MHQIQTNTTHQRSVLASLRVLVPRRPLTTGEALRIAELKANHLLRYFAVETTAVPEEIVSELSRLRIIRRHSMPISGSAHWNGRRWIITLSADEPLARQRFSLMHEFKHVLDHTTRDFLYHDRPHQTAAEQAERVADYFAACLLMPKRVVKRLWCQGNQDLPALAWKLQVSVPALRYRLHYLGLTEPADRCEYRPAGGVPTSARRRYLRQINPPTMTGGRA
jgi:Zn-dependent peptidase ImmA (M78 family)